MPSSQNKFSEWRDDARRAFREFLAVPACFLAAFVLLAAATYAVDGGAVEWLTSVRSALRQRLFSDPASTADLLGTIAGSMITMTSFSFGLLLLAVQQTAASMTSYVIDQFLRRRINQLYFGFFVGLALYALIVLATASADHNPVIGASIALILVSVALCLLILLLYTTINQIRPAVVIEALHDLTLAARQDQLSLLRKTRRARHPAIEIEVPVKSEQAGYVVHIDIGELKKKLPAERDGVEIVLLVSIGSFVAWGDVIATVRGCIGEFAANLSEATLKAVCLEQQRDLDRDAAYGIEQLTTIAWTSISTSKSNPAPGLLTVRSLRDVLARWTGEHDADENAGDEAALPVVYTDNVLAQLMDAFETLAVVSTESMQHQSFAEVVRALTALFHRLSPELQARSADIILRIVSGLGDHVLTADLDHALDALSEALTRAGRPRIAEAVRDAQGALRASIGKLNSRATRVPSAA